MIILAILIIIYSIAYLAIYVLAHQDANMIKPLSAMTVGMLVLLFVTALICILKNVWYFSVIIAIVIIGLIRFLLYLSKY